VSRIFAAEAPEKNGDPVKSSNILLEKVGQHLECKS